MQYYQQVDNYQTTVSLIFSLGSEALGSSQQHKYQKEQDYFHHCNSSSKISSAILPVFDDDDEIFSSVDQEGFQKYNLENNLTFTVQTLRNEIILKDVEQYCKFLKYPQINNQLQIPAVLSLKFKDEGFQSNQIEMIKQRIGIDLICIIDSSKSMTGSKIKMLKQTLSIFVGFLSAKDRLQLIAFSRKGEKLTPLKVVNNANKQYFKQIIDSIKLSSEIFIGSATEIAFQQIKQRKHNYDVTSILILSDGQDCCAKDIVTNQMKDLKVEIFTIHTFGFGKDHDAEMMTALSKLGNGAFYFIQDINLLGVVYGDFFGGLKTIVATDIKFDLQCKPEIPFDAISISKTYGSFWQEKRNQYDIYCMFHKCHLGEKVILYLNFQFLASLIQFFKMKNIKYQFQKQIQVQNIHKIDNLFYKSATLNQFLLINQINQKKMQYQIKLIQKSKFNILEYKQHQSYKRLDKFVKKDIFLKLKQSYKIQKY